jgi:uncharacterized peroxidase-related enzyme
MAFIKTIAPGSANDQVQGMYRQLQGGMPYLPNYARVFSHRPQVMDAWSELQRQIKATMSERRYSLITLVAAHELGSSYCALAHGRKLLSRVYSVQQLVAILNGAQGNPLSKAERVMLGFVRQVVRAPAEIRAEDVTALTRQGFSDEEIFDVVAAASARSFFARIPDALGVQPDAALGNLSEELIELLVVGRPVEQAATLPGSQVLAVEEEK